MLLRKLHLVNFREKFLKSALIEAAVTITSKSLTSSLSNQYPFQYFMKSQRLQNKSTPHFQSIIMAILVSRCQIVKWDFFAVKWYLQRLDFELKKTKSSSCFGLYLINYLAELPGYLLGCNFLPFEDLGCRFFFNKGDDFLMQ